ncbi:MAG TPA: TetR family transcriptional regulator C-terminal domain-containing protein [Actinoplanes sp.]
MSEARRRAARKRADVLAAAGAVVAARGAEATRFADVTAATGVGISTLQYYFGSREDMLIAVFRHAAQADFDAVETRLSGLGDPWERLVTIAAHLSGDTGWRVWVESWRWALRDPEVRADVLGDYARWHELIAAEVAAGETAKTFRLSRTPTDTARQVLALIDGLALPVALGDTQIPGDLLTDALSRLLGRAS